MKKTTYLVLLTLFPLVGWGQCFVKFGGGENNIIAQKSDGTVWFWGWGANGQSGLGNSQNQLLPVLYGNFNQPWLDFNAGYQNTFVIAPSGALWGSGGNNLGQLGVGTVQVQYNSPVQVSPGTSWRSVHSTAHTLAIQSNGSLWGWGQNNSGEMGNGTCCNNQLSPIQIGTATDWKQVQTSLTGASLALKQNGTLWGWGGNAGRLVSTPSNLIINYPTQIGTDTDWAYLSIGASHALGLKQDGSLWSWGSNPQGANGTGSSSNVPQRVGTDTWIHISAGLQHSLGVKTDGTLWAWGRNDFSQLGDGTTTSQAAPVQIGTDTDWVAVAGGGLHSVGLKSNGSLWSWGRNVYGQSGNGTTTQSPIPLYVPVEGCVLRVGDFQQIPLVAYPNPTSDRVSFSVQTELDSLELEVYDMMGKKVLQTELPNGESPFTVSLGHLPQGVYIVTLVQNQRVLGRQRIVRE